VDCHLERITVHYQAFGEGRPLFVLPGWPDPWQIPADYLEPHFVDRPGWRRFYLDLPGRGATRGEPWIQSNDDVLSVILDVIDHLAPTGPFVLAGQSAGAYLARAVLRRRFERVDGLLQVVPVVHVDELPEALPSPVTIERDPTLVARIAAEFGRDMAEGFATRIVMQTPQMYERFRALVPDLLRHDAAFLTMLAAREELSFDVDADAAPFLRPSLFVLGRQDAVVGYESALGLMDAYPSATMVVLDRAGHALPWEQPHLFAALAAEWLDRIEREAIDIGDR
jgi:pimeloyl-ACP methyl ester carboxylesterase